MDARARARAEEARRTAVRVAHGLALLCMPDTLTFALEYAEAGVHVFPLRPGSKTPATLHGVLDATTDEASIRHWWDAEAHAGADPDYGVGIACGPSGFFVVDVDAKSGFAASGDAREALGLPETYTVATKGGGWHFYFRGDGPSTVGRLLPGVDTRGSGGYVVAPPTPGYEVLWNERLADVPPATLEALRRPARVEAHDAFDRRGALAGVPEGARQDTLFRYACSLRARGVEHDEAAVLVTHAAESCDPPFDYAEALRVVDRVFASYDAPEEAQAATGSLLRPLGDFAAETVEWFWHPYIPLGKLTVVGGVQGQGKSFVTAALAAAATGGADLPLKGRPLPAPGPAIFASYEDGIGDTVRWRMEQQGADLERVFILPSGTDGRRAFKASDLPKLEAALGDMPGCRLLVIDPISSFLGGGIDGNSNEAVRAALEPLHHLAGRFGVAVIAVIHLNKTELSNALYRVSGANAFTALPRSVLLVGREPGVIGRRGIGQIKNNLGPLADVAEFTIGPEGLRWSFGQSTLEAEDLVRSK